MTNRRGVLPDEIGQSDVWRGSGSVPLKGIQLSGVNRRRALGGTADGKRPPNDLAPEEKHLAPEELDVTSEEK